jgi:hypothetical protein
MSNRLHHHHVAGSTDVQMTPRSRRVKPQMKPSAGSGLTAANRCQQSRSMEQKERSAKNAPMPRPYCIFSGVDALRVGIHLEPLFRHLGVL